MTPGEAQRLFARVAGRVLPRGDVEGIEAKIRRLRTDGDEVGECLRQAELFNKNRILEEYRKIKPEDIRG